MRRKTATSGDSLELLLDAVTNAFGGILFLAILIVILVNKTADQTAKSATPELGTAADILMQAADLRAEIESLSRAIQEQEKSLSQLQFDENAEQYNRIAKMQREISRLEQERDRFIIHNKELLEQAAQARQSQKQLDLQVHDQENQKASLQAELARLKLPQVRTAKTPRLRRSNKKEFPLILRYGRIYVPYVLDSATGLKTFNEEEFILIDDEIDVTRVTPKPYRGTAIDDSGELSTQLTQRLQGINKDDYYVAIAVWSESFEEFNELRNALVNLGFEYRIIPVEPGGAIQEGAIGESLVQ